MDKLFKKEHGKNVTSTPEILFGSSFPGRKCSGKYLLIEVYLYALYFLRSEMQSNVHKLILFTEQFVEIGLDKTF